MRLDIREFRMMQPGMHPHNRQPSYATVARNLWPGSGEFSPLCASASTGGTITKLASTQTLQRIPRINGNFSLLQIPDYSFAQSPAIEDQFERIFFGNINTQAGEFSELSMRDDYTNSASYQTRPMGGFVRPPRAPFIVPSQTAPNTIKTDTALGIDTTTFVTTLINDRGEESAPSRASRIYGYDPGDVIDHVIAWSDSQFANLRHVRLYMELEGTFVLLYELDFASFDVEESISNALPSTWRAYRWNTDNNGAPLVVDPYTASEISGTELFTAGAVPPPGDLHNLVSTTNGLVYALGANRRTIYVSDVFNPLSYPRQIPQRFRVEQLVVSGNTVVALRAGTHSVLYGTQPDNVYQTDIEFAEPLLSRRGAVDMGYGVMYPSPNGICLITGQTGSIVTQDNRIDGNVQILDPKAWNTPAIDSNTFVASRFEGHYIYYRYITNRWHGFAFNLKFQEIVELPPVQSPNMHLVNHVETDQLDVYTDDNVQLVPRRFHAGDLVAGYWAREFDLPDGMPFSCARVTANSYANTELIVDGTQVPVRGPQLLRIPSTNRKRRVQLGVTGTDVVQRIQFAHTVSELD